MIRSRLIYFFSILIFGSSSCSRNTAPENELNEVILVSYGHANVGCALQEGLLGGDIWEKIAISFSASFSFEKSKNGVANSSGMMLLKKTKELQLGSCMMLSPEEVNYPSLGCLNAGGLTMKADWEGWSPFTLEYSKTTKNYPSRAVFGKNIDHYQGGRSIDITAEGGPDIEGFAAHLKSMTPIELLSPSTDADGMIVNVPQDAPLDVAWSGGDSESLIIFIESEWVPIGGDGSYLGCHVENNGNFTIPKEFIEEFKWANQAMLTIFDYSSIILDIPELPNAGLLANVSANLIINLDPDATPPLIPSGDMKPGFVGNRCKNDSECGGGQCFMDDVFTRINDYGYCSISKCRDDEDCPADANCFFNNVPAIPYFSFCAKKCLEDNDCRIDDGYVCIDENCIPGVW